MKKFYLFFLLIIILVFSLVRAGQSKIKSYYSGDAVNFNDQLYIGSTNSDSLEVFKLDNQQLKPLFKISTPSDRFGNPGRFYDLKFSVEGAHLFVYATSEASLYKYEIVDDSQMTLINSNKNTYWEWYSRVDKFGSDLVTISNKGIKVWNKDLQVVNSYQLADSLSPYNLRAYNSDSILDVQDNHLSVYSRSQRANVLSIPVNYKAKVGNRQPYQDESGNLFIVDDYYTKKFDATGKLVASFQHAPYLGYDVSASGVSNYIYFSNGAGLVKLDQDSLKQVTYRWTSSLGGPAGWAMGLKVVDLNGDKVVLFNGSNILVLDENLRKLASVEASDKSDEANSLENLYLNLDHSLAKSNDTIVLSGGGYFPNEQLSVSFGGVNSNFQADSHGRFSQKLVVPNLTQPVVDIKVAGNSSRLSYSISFRITQ